MPHRIAVIAIWLLVATAVRAQAPVVDGQSDPLPPGAVARFGSARLRHIGPLRGMALTLDGKTLITAGCDGTARVWDAASGRELRRLTRPLIHNMQSSVSPDGRTVATTAGEFIHLWDVATGTERHTEPVRNTRNRLTLTFCASSLIALQSNPSSVQVFDATTGRETGFIPIENPFCSAAAMSTDGRCLAVAVYAESIAIELWDVATRRLVSRLSGFQYAPSFLQFTPDGKRLIVTEPEGALSLWEIANSKRIHDFERSEGTTVSSLVMTPEGTTVAAAFEYQERGRRGDVRRANASWNVDTGRMIHRIEGDGRGFPQMAISRDGTTFVLGSHEGTVCFRNPATGADRHGFDAHRDQIYALAFSPDGKSLATASADETIRIWSVACDRPSRVLRGHGSEVRCVAFSPDGRRLASAGGWDGTYRLWDVSTGETCFTSRHLDDRIFGVSFSPDGQTLAVTGQARVVRCFTPETGVRRPPELTWRGPIAIWSPDGTMIAIAGIMRDQNAHVVHLTDATTGRIRCTFNRHPKELTSAVFSADGRLFASSGGDVHLWEPATGQSLFRFHEPDEPTSAVALSPDSKLVAFGVQDGSIRVHETMSGRELRRFTLPDPRVLPMALAFSPDGSRLASTAHSSALLWDVSGLSGRVKKPLTALSAEQLAMRWEQLADIDSRVAYAAGWELTADPPSATAYLREQLTKIDWPTPQRLQRLTDDLAAPRYTQREAAMRELSHYGELAANHLTNSRPAGAEAARRITELIRRLDDPTVPRETLRVRRAITVLERLSATEALQQLATRDIGPSLADDLRRTLRRLPSTTENDASKPKSR